MDEWSASIITMILGAFLGSIISPASEMYFANKFLQKGEAYSFSNGLVLLCAANATWVISFILVERSKTSITAMSATFFLYVVAAILLIASFSQFKKTTITEDTKPIRGILLFLILGNLLWLIAEASEVILIMLDMDAFPHLWVKYVLFFLSATLFVGGIISFMRRRENPNKTN